MDYRLNEIKELITTDDRTLLMEKHTVRPGWLSALINGKSKMTKKNLLVYNDLLAIAKKRKADKQKLEKEIISL